ncbi:MAG TPA: hypothetical protein VF163_08175, partial [Micromonosporaceae bacterium]
MSPPLTESLHDLAVAGSRRHSRDELATVAWAAGRRRRRRRRVTSVATVVALVLMLLPFTWSVASGVPAADGDRRGVDGYPVRIGHQWIVTDLPDRPGPVAALIQLVTGNLAGWEAVTTNGRRWRIPARHNSDDVFPSLSPDGRLVGYLVGDDGPYVIHDLVSGVRTEFPEFGTGIMTARTPLVIEGQHPSYWSPRGDRLLVQGRNRADSVPTAFVLSLDGSIQVINNEPDPGGLAGWLDDQTIAMVAWDETNWSPEAIVKRSLDGGPDAVVALKPDRRWTGTFYGQWSTSASPDGAQLAVLEEVGGGTAVHRFSLADGTEITEPVSVSRLELPCMVGWIGDVATVPANDFEAGNVSTVRVDQSVSRVAIVQS